MLIHIFDPPHSIYHRSPELVGDDGSSTVMVNIPLRSVFFVSVGEEGITLRVTSLSRLDLYTLHCVFALPVSIFIVFAQRFIGYKIERLFPAERRDMFLFITSRCLLLNVFDTSCV